jgi:hypothetical protein
LIYYSTKIAFFQYTKSTGRIKKTKSVDLVLFLGGDAGVVGASARCNSKTSVLAQASERQPGPAGSSGQNAHCTAGAPRIKGKRKNGLNCPFCSFGGAISKIFEPH